MFFPFSFKFLVLIIFYHLILYSGLQVAEFSDDQQWHFEIQIQLAVKWTSLQTVKASSLSFQSGFRYFLLG
jgi:hypothetical protein